MNTNMISVIMPCYNDGAYIQEAIESIKIQTYKDWELIIIDDGSDDTNTVNIINRIEDERITILHTNHLRPAGARNYGIEHAKGKYILPVDSDDKIDPSYMQKAVEIIESEEAIGVVYCYADLFGDRSGRWELPDYSFEKMLLDNVVFVTALFYKEDWDKVGGFNTQLIAGMEDYDFWLGILGLGRKIYQIPEVLFHYRIKPVSRTTGFQSDYVQMQQTYRQIYNNHKEFYSEYQDEYAMVLRDALIEQIAIRMKYEKLFEKVQKFYKIPVIGSIVRKIISD